jgi:hypothetical protein
MVRFRDGMWLPAEDMTAEYAEQVYYNETRPDGKGVSLLCPTKYIARRGDTLNRSTVTLVSIDPAFSGPQALASAPHSHQTLRTSTQRPTASSQSRPPTGLAP